MAFPPALRLRELVDAGDCKWSLDRLLFRPA